MFTILVCGSRNWDDHEKVFEALKSVCDKHSLWKAPYHPDRTNEANCRIIAANSTNVDVWAIGFADCYYARYSRFELDAKHGIGASAIRNADMIAEQPDLVLCFGKDSNTDDVLSRARKANIKVVQK